MFSFYAQMLKSTKKLAQISANWETIFQYRRNDAKSAYYFVFKEHNFPSGSTKRKNFTAENS